MPRHIKIDFTKTYASIENAEAAVRRSAQKYGWSSDLRYVVMPVVPPMGGAIRYGVLFIGERAFENGIHFHFNVMN